ncbi:MAG: hypothetical protein EOP83_04310 [Verrucomicrobiaceae bacterium]|nr:MAG: hypothetical protein EOP83_04310 [Verrucomicrobiaceae bacterium]
MNEIKKFIGRNWFENQDKINTLAAANGWSTNLKVLDDVIEGTNTRLRDFTDICTLDDRLTIKIRAKGEIVSVKLG